MTKITNRGGVGEVRHKSPIEGEAGKFRKSKTKRRVEGTLYV